MRPECQQQIHLVLVAEFAAPQSSYLLELVVHCVSVYSEYLGYFLYAAVVLKLAAQELGAVAVVLGVVVQQLSQGGLNVIRKDP